MGTEEERNCVVGCFCLRVGLKEADAERGREREREREERKRIDTPRVSRRVKTYVHIEDGGRKWLVARKNKQAHSSG